MDLTYDYSLPLPVPPRTVPYGATLPGHGERGNSCGEPIVKQCQSCGHVWVSDGSCNQRECPDCWTKWLAKEAEEAGTRMWTLTKKVYYGSRHRRIVHSMVSFKPDGLSYEEAKAKAIRIAKERGIQGGLAICHVHRADGHIYDYDGTIHFHIVGIALTKISWDYSPSQGYIFKQIKDPGQNTYHGIQTYKSLLRLIRYQLSHSAIIKGHHSVTWFGTLSYNYSICGIRFGSKARFAQDFPEVMEYLSRYTPSCPICKSDHILTIWEDEARHVLLHSLRSTAEV